MLATTVLAVFLCLTPAQQSFALTTDEMFADANRLYRDELYWAALLRYRQAFEAGLDTPVLHYNMGVAHFRAAQYERARTALLKSMRAPDLRLFSQYNLGLNAYAAGDIDEALEWFSLARDQNEDAKIRRLARTAIKRLEDQQVEPDVSLAQVEKRSEERKFADFSLLAYVGYGSDDNVFRAPDQAYFDFSDPALPLITPEAFAGAFVPVDFRAKYSINSFKLESFYAAYRMSGRLYSDTELENANEYSHELSFGSSYRRTEENRDRKVFSAFTIAQHDETYFDPDDGTERELNATPIGNRMSYSRYGPEIAWVQAYERLGLGLRMKGQLWNYEDPTDVAEYDHEYFIFAAHTQYRFTQTSLLRLTIDKYSRRYSDRRAFDLDGNQLVTNPELRYDYLAVGLTARQRITRNMWFGFNVERTNRQDRHLGYYDYTRDEFGLDFRWTPNQRWKFEVRGYYRNYNYPNAFAYNNPIAGIKTLETVRSNLLTEFRITPRLSINAEAEYRQSLSSDVRISYDRTWFSVGITWKQ